MPLEDIQNIKKVHKLSRDYAVSLDNHDPLRDSKSLFHIPTKNQLKAKTLESLILKDDPGSPPVDCIYLCGNSLGLQPKFTSSRIQQFVTTWATQGVYGHFKHLSDSPLPRWLDADTHASEIMASIVGALPSEVAVMQTLTANLHILMSAFYKPDPSGRYKIIIESHAFPSDNFVAESQIKHYNLNPDDSLIIISPISPMETISTSQIISIIEEHSDKVAVLLLPGIQYYTGQFLDIPTITAVAHNAGIFVIWDLAHAVGNVVLKLHEWNVDAAVWCNYKYLNSGPGVSGSLFIHEKHSRVSMKDGDVSFVNRLSGWWGSEKSSRFTMDNKFKPIPGAAGFQLSNPSILDMTSVAASLEVFDKICRFGNQNLGIKNGIDLLRNKSIKLTNYLEDSLENMEMFMAQKFHVITPRDPEQRGAQLSLKLESGLLKVVMRELEARGVVVDERQPDVIRVAPTPLYNTFEDCWTFIQAFSEALIVAVRVKNEQIDSKATENIENSS